VSYSSLSSKSIIRTNLGINESDLIHVREHEWKRRGDTNELKIQIEPPRV
jgi:hypothetical protein